MANQIIVIIFFHPFDFGSSFESFVPSTRRRWDLDSHSTLQQQRGCTANRRKWRWARNVSFFAIRLRLGDESSRSSFLLHFLSHLVISLMHCPFLSPVSSAHGILGPARDLCAALEMREKCFNSMQVSGCRVVCGLLWQFLMCRNIFCCWIDKDCLRIFASRQSRHSFLIWVMWDSHETRYAPPEHTRRSIWDANLIGRPCNIVGREKLKPISSH